LSLFFKELSRLYGSFNTYETTKQPFMDNIYIYFFFLILFRVYYEAEIQFWFEYSERAEADVVFVRTRAGDVATRVTFRGFTVLKQEGNCFWV
jgi:hypothetical protein